jgi:hypothetical protein
MAPDVVAIAKDWGADLIVRESLEFAGAAAAEVLEIPHASVGAPADSALDQRREFEESLAVLRETLGLSVDPGNEMVYRYLHLSFMPPRFNGPSASFPATTHFLRHENLSRPGESLPDWIADFASLPIHWQPRHHFQSDTRCA